MFLWLSLSLVHITTCHSCWLERGKILLAKVILFDVELFGRQPYLIRSQQITCGNAAQAPQASCARRADERWCAIGQKIGAASREMTCLAGYLGPFFDVRREKIRCTCTSSRFSAKALRVSLADAQIHGVLHKSSM